MNAIARAPGRVNLIGEHTDYTGGLALPMAIDRHIDITIQSRVDDHVELSSETLDGTVVVDLTLDDPLGAYSGPDWGRYVAAVAGELDEPHGFVGHIASSVPDGAGLSSSAALEVAVAVAMGADNSTPEAVLDLAKRCQRAEHRATGVPTGLLDQLCIAGATDSGATRISFGDPITITPVAIPDDVAVWVRFVAHRRLEGSAYADRVAECNAAIEIIGPLTAATLKDIERLTEPIIAARARHVITENARVDAFIEALNRGAYNEAGALMVASHESLASDFAVSTDEMDAAVQDYLDTPGVYGARLTGGGFGGCVVVLADPTAELDGWRVAPATGARVITT